MKTKIGEEWFGYTEVTGDSRKFQGGVVVVLIEA